MTSLPFSSSITAFLCTVLVVSPIYGQAQSPNLNVPTPPPDALQIRVLNAEQVQAGFNAGAKQQLRVEVTDPAGTGVANAAVTCRLPDSGPTGTFSDGSHAAVAYTDSSGQATIDAVQWGEVPGKIAVRLTATKGAVHTGILLDTTLQANGVRAEPAVNTDLVAAPIATTAVFVPAKREEAGPAIVSSQPIAIPSVSVTKPGSAGVPQPGVPAKAAANNPSPDKLKPNAADPAITVTRTSAADAPHSSHAKWYVLALVAVAAGAGAGFAMKGKSSTATNTPTASISIGTPSVSVGH
jgi:hypothetical protein